VQTGLVFHTHDTTICQKFTSPFRGAAVKIVTPKTHENRHHVLGLFGTLHWILTKMACQRFPTKAAEQFFDWQCFQQSFVLLACFEQVRL
jgi:hypothetical protein